MNHPEATGDPETRFDGHPGDGDGAAAADVGPFGSCVPAAARRADHPVSDAEGLPDAAWAVFQELRPQFDGLVQAGLVHDYVNQAVRDLNGSISIEALPEMAIRLAAVRLRQRLRPDQRADELQVLIIEHGSDAEELPAGAAVFPFTVIPFATPGGATPISMTVTTTQQATWTAPEAPTTTSPPTGRRHPSTGSTMSSLTPNPGQEPAL